jgi:PTH2 family peptidyl-tRNA hydrolase
MVKQVILFRKDLNMRLGKVAAQVAHASMKVFFDLKLSEGQVAEILDTGFGGELPEDTCDLLVIPTNPPMRDWVWGSFAKIVLSVDSEEELLRAYELAKAAGLPTALIVDEGRTEFHGVPTNTTVAIGPAPSEEIDKITGKGGAVQTRLA